MRDQVQSCGCLKHPSGKCALESCDLCVFGTPCPPFSQFRGKRYRGSSVAEHSQVHTTMEDARDMLVVGQHKAVIMEQVPGFDMPDHAGASTESTFMRRFLQSVQQQTRELKKPGYHVLILKASYQEWVKVMRDRTARALEIRVNLASCFKQLFTSQRRVSSVAAEADFGSDVTRQTLTRCLLWGASFLVHFAGYMMGLLLSTLTLLCSAVSPEYRAVLVTVRRLYDETPSKVAASWMSHSEQGRARAREDGGAAKVLQTQMDITVLMQHLPSGKFFSLAVPCQSWLQAIDRTTAETTVAAQTSLLQMIPGLNELTEKSKFRIDLTCTDRFAANVKAERHMSSAINGVVSHQLCDIHRLAGCQSRVLGMVDSHITGMIATALACADAGNTRSLRAAMVKVLRDKVRVCYGAPRENPDHVAYRQAVLDAFLPLGKSKQDIGDEDDPDALTKKELTLKARKQRAIISYFLHDDLQNTEDICFFSERWGLDVDQVVRVMERFLVPALLPRRPPLFARNRWTGFSEAVCWFGLAECCHSLLSATIREYLSPKVQAANQQLQHVALAAHRLQDNVTRPDEDRDEDDEETAEMRRETDALTSNLDWAALKLRMKQKALTWFQQDILPALVAISIAVGPLHRFFCRTLDKGSVSWEKVQQAKAANDCPRTFAVQEAARGTDLHLYRADMNQAFHERVVPLPSESCLQHVQALHFRMLSRSLCSVEVHLRSWSTYPIKLFLALDGRNDAMVDSPCLFCPMTKALLAEYDDLDNPEARAILLTLASKYRLHIAGVEARHAATRRLTTIRGVQTKVPELSLVNADFVLRSNFLKRADVVPVETSVKHEKKTVESSSKVRQARRSQAWNAYQSANIGGPRSGRRWAGERIQQARDEYHALTEQEKQHYVDMAEVAQAARSRGLPAYPRTTESQDGLVQFAATSPNALQLVDLGHVAEAWLLQDMEEKLSVVRLEDKEDARLAQDWLQTFEESRSSYKQDDEVLQQCLVGCESFRSHCVPALTGILSGHLHIPAETLGQDFLAGSGRSKDRAKLLESWRDLNDIVFHDEQPPLDGELQEPLSRCNQLGLCVCEGKGLRAWLFHARLTLFLKAEFTPKRQKKQQNIHGIMELAASEKPKQARLQQNRKLLNDAFIVLRLQVKPEEDFAFPASSHPRPLHNSWLTLATQQNDPGKGCLWLHLGHVNLSTWMLGVLLLDPSGPPDENGRQRLQVPDPARAFLSIEAFLKSVESFDPQYQCTVFTILSTGERLVEEDMVPDYVFVRRLEQVPEFTFWQGLVDEQRRHEESLKRVGQKKRSSSGKASAAKRTRTAQGAKEKDGGQPDATLPEASVDDDAEEFLLVDNPNDPNGEDDDDGDRGSESSEILEELMRLAEQDEDQNPEEASKSKPSAAAEGKEVASGSKDGPAGKTRREGQATDKVSFLLYGDIRFNHEENHLMAVCAVHEDCRKARTCNAATAAHLVARNPFQGRPLGLLSAWLKLGSKFKTAAEHKAASTMKSISFQDRQQARSEFLSKPGFSGFNEMDSKPIYLVFLRKDVYSLEDARFMQSLYKELLEKQRRVGPKEIDQVLRVDEDAAVGSTLHDRALATSRGTVWQRDSATIKKQLGVSPTFKPWTSRRGFLGGGLGNNARMLEALDCFVASELKRVQPNADCEPVHVQSMMEGKFMDVSQSVKRNKHSTPTGFVHTLTTSTLLYSFSLDRVLSGREMLSLHCQPRDLVIPEEVRDSQVRDLAGEGMALPCLASVVWCLYLTKQFPA
ncbi:unnamed protein product [Symbiodinium sp. CCMP2592]|nr:unnamed protein product [Symbiodinium sp. CCMP2592]